MGRSVSVDFHVLVNANASAIVSYEWDFGDSSSSSNTLSTTGPDASHTYQSPGTYIVSVTAAVPARCPPALFGAQVIVKPCLQGTTGNGNGSGTGMSVSCWILLILALVFSILGAVVATIAACTGPSWQLVLTAVVGFLLSLLFLLLWYFFCVRGNCKALNQGRHFVQWILAIVPIAGLIASVLVGYNSLACGLWAGLFSAVLWGYWGEVLSVLDALARQLKCITENG